MPSELAWVDTSEDERRRMREVIDLFKERDTVDELGIGSIRDTLSDVLLPGLSTIQTRARYFFFVPWVYQRLEADHTPSAKAAQRARRLQTDLVDALLRGSAEGESGIIGSQARETVRRLPSSVYWSGLRAFGFRRGSGSIEDYHRSLDGFYRRLKSHRRGEGDELHERPPTNWHQAIPQRPDNLFDEATFEFTRAEAEFLREQVAFTQPRSLLKHLLFAAAADKVPTPWEHPATSDLPPDVDRWLQHARAFSDVMHGAALTYNLLLAQLAVERSMEGSYEQWGERYSRRLDRWQEAMAAHSTRHAQWDRREFWDLLLQANPRIPRRTQLFVSQWSELVVNDPQHAASTPTEVRQLINDREVFLKRNQARLTSHRALELWNGESAASPLDYRWPTAAQLLTDVHEGLARA